MEGYPIREFIPADHPAAFALWSRTEGLGLGPSDSLDAISIFLARNPGLSEVACSTDGMLVGTLLCGHDGRRGYLHHLAVEPAHRRRGIGRTLVDRALGRLASLGLEKCNLFLFAANESGRTFWVNQGWLLRDNIVLVQKSLSSAAPCCRQSC